MSRRRGEMSPAQLDREYPHQVMVPADWHLTLPAQGFYLQGRKLSLAPRHHSVYVGGSWRTIYCFAEAADADLFCAHVAGERFDPRRRGRGPRWAQVTPT